MEAGWGPLESLQKKGFWWGRKCCTLLWPGTGCSRGAEEATSPERCPACSGLHSTSSFYPAGYAAPYLTVFSENSIDVFDVRKAEWVQTVPLKKVRACQDPGAAGEARAHGVTSVPVASGATPEPRGLPVPLWRREDPPDLPQEPSGR